MVYGFVNDKLCELCLKITAYCIILLYPRFRNKKDNFFVIKSID
jgi:hypothetical protein